MKTEEETAWEQVMPFVRKRNRKVGPQHCEWMSGEMSMKLEASGWV